MTNERCGTCPDPDASEIQAIEISFAIPVFMTQDQQGRLVRLVDDIIDQPWNEPKDGVHWLAEVGAKPNWSQIDSLFMGETPNPDAPQTGEPTFDDSIFSIGSCAREFVSEKERDRVLERRSKPKREMAQAESLAKLFHETYERLAPSFGYETRKDSAVPWDEVPENQKKLMTATCKEVQEELNRISSEKWRNKRRAKGRKSICHVAGPVVAIRSINRAVQRCAMCGEKLADNKNQTGPVGPNGESPEWSHWAEAHLIRVEGTNPTHYADVGDWRDESIPVPEDFCIDLVE